MEEIVRLILMIRGKTAPLHCSAGVTSMMGSVMANVTAQGVSMMALIAKGRKDSASKFENREKVICGGEVIDFFS